ncbi:MAG: nucleoside triphosphate pyrophosphohydrolase [Methylacidiphilales bacterium]|nr:nucleoside triphosphate pyrophosphohydrolase [Candidatus Methylacidiphilales bacterium]
MESVKQLKDIIARLRAPDGCPWDREQTHESIKPQLLEECYEVLEAIDEKSDSMLREELGDVLLHIVFHAQLAEERGVFTLETVVREICEKLVRRHPHVFGEDKLSTSGEVLHRWEEIKKKEKPERKGALDGVPRHLPALMQAQEIQKKAAKVGFDWQELRDVLAKVKEEIAEIEKDFQNPEKLREEVGDLLFSVVNFARHCKMDAEESCRQANRKFVRRFEWMEKNTSRPLKGLTLSELDALWNQAKKATD